MTGFYPSIPLPPGEGLGEGNETSMKLTRESLDRVTRELGLTLDSEELEILFQRMNSLTEALGALEEMVEPSIEPFPAVRLPEEE